MSGKRVGMEVSIAAAEAVRANGQAMEKVFAALEAAGIPKTHVRTAHFSLFPVHADAVEPRAQPRIVGYRASHQVTVRVAGVEKVGGVLDHVLLRLTDYLERADELRSDLEKAYSLIPGKHRLNLHALYAETGGKRVERNALTPDHFATWIAWAKEQGLGMDFNPSLFSHPLAESGFTLSSRDESTRRFWIEHCIASRKIGEAMGRELGSPCVTNIWIPDGYKDTPVDRKEPREILAGALDEVLAAPIDKAYNLDAVESKLFGIGSESYVVGSHEFYLAYAVQRRCLLCLDAVRDFGHQGPVDARELLSSLGHFLFQPFVRLVYRRLGLTPLIGKPGQHPQDHDGEDPVPDRNPERKIRGCGTDESPQDGEPGPDRGGHHRHPREPRGGGHQDGCRIEDVTGKTERRKAVEDKPRHQGQRHGSGQNPLFV